MAIISDNDTEHTSRCDITFDIVDKNDNAPKFIDVPYKEEFISYIEGTERIIKIVKAIDRDSDVLGMVYYVFDEETNLFNIDEDLGEGISHTAHINVF